MSRPAAAAVEERARLDRLRALAVLDTRPEALFDHITELAARLCGVPIALVSLVDAERQWFKSAVGLPGTSETHRDDAFCAHAILDDALMEVPDATLDLRFAGNPLVTGSPDIRFYAGAPIVLPGRERVGTVCVLDRVPRQLTPLQRDALVSLGRMAAVALLERERLLQREAEVARVHATYRMIVEGQTEMISVADPDGTLRFVNAAYARFFGLLPPEIVGRPLTDFVTPQDRGAVALHLQAVVRTGLEATGVNGMSAADGSRRWVMWVNRLIREDDGRAPYIHSVGRDITAQKRAEEALAASEDRARRMYEATPAMLQSIDAQGRLLGVSDVWLAKLGYERGAAVGRPASDFLAPESRQRERTVVMPALLATGRCDDVDYRMLRSDGTLLAVRMSAVLERDARGLPARALAVMVDMTEKLSVQDQLDQTTQLLQRVVDCLPARISYWGADGRNRFANRAFVEWCDGAQRPPAGRHLRDVVGPDWLDRMQPMIDAALAGRPGALEATALAPDGASQVLELRFAPDLRGGEVQGLIVFALDITPRRHAERELAAHERRFRLLVDGVRDYAICLLDPQGQVATWNAGAERIHGHAADEVIGRHLRTFFTAADAAAGKPEQELACAARDGRFEAEDWRLRKDGSRFFAGALLSALHDDEHRLVGYAAITRDLTERRRQQALLDRTFELAPCALLMIDARGRIAMANGLAEEVFGWRRAELVGRTVDTLVPERLRAPHAGLRRAFAADATVRAMGSGREVVALRRDGREFAVEIGLSPIDTGDGQGTLAAVFDITERRRQQAATERALAEKEVLLKEVHHRVKNNLQVISSLLQLQAGTIDDERARQVFEESQDRIKSMALVHEKLYQTRDLSHLDFGEYLRELVSGLGGAHHAASSRVGVVVVVGAVAVPLDVDRAISAGLLVNELVSNSFKHGFPGRRPGRIEVTLSGGGAAAVELVVRDDGVGWAADFDPATTKSLGLRLVHSLARQLRARLQIECAGGVRCTLTLPAESARAAQA